MTDFSSNMMTIIILLSSFSTICGTYDPTTSVNAKSVIDNLLDDIFSSTEEEDCNFNTDNPVEKRSIDPEFPDERRAAISELEKPDKNTKTWYPGLLAALDKIKKLPAQPTANSEIPESVNNALTSWPQPYQAPINIEHMPIESIVPNHIPLSTNHIFGSYVRQFPAPGIVMPPSFPFASPYEPWVNHGYVPAPMYGVPMFSNSAQGYWYSPYSVFGTPTMAPAVRMEPVVTDEIKPTRKPAEDSRILLETDKTKNNSTAENTPVVPIEGNAQEAATGGNTIETKKPASTDSTNDNTNSKTGSGLSIVGQSKYLDCSDTPVFDNLNDHAGTDNVSKKLKQRNKPCPPKKKLKQHLEKILREARMRREQSIFKRKPREKTIPNYW